MWKLKPSISFIFRITFCFVALLPVKIQDADAWTGWAMHLVNVCLVIVLAVLLPHFKYPCHLLKGFGKAAGKLLSIREGWLIGAAAVSFFLLTCFLSGHLFGHLPHIADSQAQYIQAKLFLSGHLTVPVHPLQSFFPIQYFGTHENRMYSSYPPGHAFLLMLGMLIGMPWIINPLMGALFVVTLYFLGREIGNRTTGYIAMLLAAVSPYIVFMSSEYMNHATALLMLTLFVLFYIRMLKYRHWQDAVFAGCAVGYLGITRPQCVVPLGLCFALHAAWMSCTRLRQYGWLNLLLFICGMPFLGVFCYYNWSTTGGAFLTGYEAAQFASRDWLTSWKNPAFPWEDFKRAAEQSGTLGLEFFCWPVSSFALMAGLFLCKAEKRYCFLLAGTFLAFFSGLMLISSSWTNLFSARFLYETSGMVIVLSALALQRIPALARRYVPPRVSLSVWGGTLILVCIAFTGIGFHGRTGELYALYRHHYWEGNADYYEGILHHIKKPALVYVRNYKRYRYVIFNFPYDNDSPVVFALKNPRDNEQLRDYFPGRYVYEVIGSNPPPEPLDIWTRLPNAGHYYIREINEVPAFPDAM